MNRHAFIFAAAWLALSAWAAAATVLQDLVIIGEPIPTTPLAGAYDVDEDGVSDLQFSGLLDAKWPVAPAVHVRLVTLNGTGTSLGENFILDGNLAPGHLWANVAMNLSTCYVLLDQNVVCLGPWSVTGEYHYLGLEITRPDGVHYAWMHFAGQRSIGYPITKYYENTPGLSLVTGTPEPSRTLLLLLGILSLLHRRRRALGSG